MGHRFLAGADAVPETRVSQGRAAPVPRPAPSLTIPAPAVDLISPREILL